MIREQVLIDIEFANDETQFKLAQLDGTTEGISDVTQTGVCKAITAEKVCADWATQKLAPQCSTIIACTCTPSGKFLAMLMTADIGLAES